MEQFKINVQDNQYDGVPLSKLYATALDNKAAVENLRFLAETPINDLADKAKEDLLIFPHCLHAQHHDLKGSDTLFTFQQQLIKTGNYLGFIGRGNVELSITSRFDKNKGNFFLHYMLQKVFAINLFDLKTSKNNDTIWDFLPYLFPHYLKRALSQGMFKKYRTYRYNDAKVRGTIDVSRHIKENIPFRGKVAYTTKEYSFDNHLTQLIRHTIEYIQGQVIGGRNLLHSDVETSQAVSQIMAATPSYYKNKRLQVMAENVKPERHPYFTEYTFLQQLCLKILRKEKMSLAGEQNDKVYGIIFDGAWLWEQYLKTILPVDYAHYDNRGNGKHACLFEGNDRRIYPDFYNSEQGIVLDAKYKFLNDSIPREDLYQLITYLHCLPAQKGALIYPYSNQNANESVLYGTLKGYGGTIYQMQLSISKSDTFQGFCHEMKGNEERFLDALAAAFIN